MMITVMVSAIPFKGVIQGLQYAVAHPHPQYRQGIPQTAMKNQMRRIPVPFKNKRKHFPSLILKPVVYRVKVFSSLSCGNIGR